jgi:hypothetical protein
MLYIKNNFFNHPYQNLYNSKNTQDGKLNIQSNEKKFTQPGVIRCVRVWGDNLSKEELSFDALVAIEAPLVKGLESHTLKLI